MTLNKNSFEILNKNLCINFLNLCRRKNEKLLVCKKKKKMIQQKLKIDLV